MKAIVEFDGHGADNRPLPRLRLVIESQQRIGAGTEENPCRMLTVYHSANGELLAEKDPWPEEQREKQLQECLSQELGAA